MEHGLTVAQVREMEQKGIVRECYGLNGATLLFTNELTATQALQAMEAATVMRPHELCASRDRFCACSA